MQKMAESQCPTKTSKRCCRFCMFNKIYKYKTLYVITVSKDYVGQQERVASQRSLVWMLKPIVKSAQCHPVTHSHSDGGGRRII